MKQLLMALALGVSMASNFPQVIGQMYDPLTNVALHLLLPEHRPPAAKTFSIKQTETDVGAQGESDYLTEGALW
jgi:hypothetical protein